MSIKIVFKWIIFTFLFLLVSASENEIIKNIPTEPQFQKDLWYPCWVLIHKKSIPQNLIHLILSYLKYTPKSIQQDSDNKVYKAVLSRNCRWLLSTPFYSPFLHLLNVTSGHRFQTFTTIMNTEILCPFAIADHELFVVGGGKVNIYLWRTSRESSFIPHILPHEAVINSCCIFRNNQRIASGTEDGIVRVWKVIVDDAHIQTQCLHVLPGHEQGITTCVVSPDHQFLVSMSKDASLRVWNPETGECMNVFLGHNQKVWGQSCVVSVDNQRIGSIGELGEIKVWDIATGECMFTFEFMNDGDPAQIAHVGEEKLVWWNDAEVIEWDLKGGSISTKKIYEIEVRAVTISEFGQYMVVLLRDDEYYDKIQKIPLLDVYNFKTGELVK